MCFFLGALRQPGVFSYGSCLSRGVGCPCSRLWGPSIFAAPKGTETPGSHFEGSVEYLRAARGCFGGMRNEGATDLPPWCCLTFHATGSSREGEGREERIWGSIWLRVNLS